MLAGFVPSYALHPDPGVVLGRAAQSATYASAALWGVFAMVWPVGLVWPAWRRASRFCHLSTALTVMVGALVGWLFYGPSDGGLPWSGGIIALFMFFGMGFVGLVVFGVVVLGSALAAGFVAAAALRATRWGLVPWVVVVMGLSAGAIGFAYDEAHGPRLSFPRTVPGGGAADEPAPDGTEEGIHVERFW